MRRILATLGSALLLTSCDESTPPGGPTDDLITLTASQAAALVDRFEQLSFSDPTLSSLADTVRFVLTAGAEAQRIDATTNFGTTSYYVVSLHRVHSGTPQSWSTFHVFGFNDPSNPTEFLILGGSSATNGPTPPTSATGSIGATGNTSLTGHFFSMSGSNVHMWHADAGTVSLSASATAESCPGFSAPGMTCVRSDMSVTFAITGTVPENGATGERTGSGTDSSVPGVRLSM
jgi:hypothetical protein